MAHKLVCTIPFAHFQKGDEVTDTAEIETYLASHPKHVVRVAVPDEPATAPYTAPKPAVLTGSDPT